MLSSRNILAALLVGLAALAGCSGEGEKESIGAIDSEITLQAQVLGSIAPNETKTGSYAGAPENRAFSFNATGGDTITADVSLQGGDAVGFITDASFLQLAQNDDSGPGTGDSRVTFTVPAGPTRSFRIVFRNSAAPSGNFRVRLGIQAGACNPPAEPWHTYLGNPDECDALHWTCPAGETRFINACGCGCERPN
jgi:hypothetical protein